MKQRVIISVLATVLILTLCVGVFVACNPNPSNPPEPEAPQTQDGDILLKFVGDSGSPVLGYSVVSIEPQDYPDYEYTTLEAKHFPVTAPAIEGKQFMGWFCEQKRGEDTYEVSIDVGTQLGYPDTYGEVYAEKNSTLTVFAKYATVGALADSIAPTLYGTFYDYQSKFVISEDSVKYYESCYDEDLEDYVLHEFVAELGKDIYTPDFGRTGYYVVLKDTATNNAEADLFCKIANDAGYGLLQYTFLDDYPSQYECNELVDATPELDEKFYGVWSVTVEAYYPGSGYYTEYLLDIKSATDITFGVSGRAAKLTAYANENSYDYYSESFSEYYLVMDLGYTYNIYTISLQNGKVHFGPYSNDYVDLEPADIINYFGDDNSLLGYNVVTDTYGWFEQEMFPAAPQLDGKLFIGFYPIGADGALGARSVGAGDSYGIADEDPTFEYDENGRLEFKAKYLTVGEYANSISDLNGTWVSDFNEVIVISDNTIKYTNPYSTYTATLGSSIYAATKGVYVELKDDNQQRPNIVLNLYLENDKLYEFDMSWAESEEANELTSYAGYGEVVTVDNSYLGSWYFTLPANPEIYQFEETDYILILTADKYVLNIDSVPYEVKAYANPAGGYYFVYEPGYLFEAYEAKYDATTEKMTLKFTDEMGQEQTLTSELKTEPVTVKFLDENGETLQIGVLANVTAGGTSLREAGAFPTAPELSGKWFLGWYQVKDGQLTDTKLTAGSYAVADNEPSSGDKANAYIGTAKELVIQMKYVNYAEGGSLMELPEAYLGTYFTDNAVIEIGFYSVTYRSSTGRYSAPAFDVYTIANGGGYYVILTPDDDDNNTLLFKIVLNADETLSAQNYGAGSAANTYAKLPDYGEETTLGADYYGKEYEYVEEAFSPIFNVTYTLSIDDEGYALFTISSRSGDEEYELSIYADPDNEGKYFVLCDNGGNTILHYALSFDADGNAVLSDPDSGEAVYTLAPKAAEEA